MASRTRPIYKTQKGTRMVYSKGGNRRRGMTKVALAKGSQFGDQLQGNLINAWPKRRAAFECSFMTSPLEGKCMYGGSTLSEVVAMRFNLTKLPNYGAIQNAWQRYRVKKMEVLVTNVKVTGSGSAVQHLYIAGYKEDSTKFVPEAVTTVMGCAYKQIDTDTVQIRKAIAPVYALDTVENSTSGAGVMQSGYVESSNPNVEWNSFVIQFGQSTAAPNTVSVTFDYVLNVTLQLDRPKYQGVTAPSVVYTQTQPLVATGENRFPRVTLPPEPCNPFLPVRDYPQKIVKIEQDV